MEPLANRYQMLELISVTASNRVCLAEDTHLKKYVVIKEFQGKTADPDFLRREADVLKHLHHEALPAVLDLFETDGKTYTVIDHIDGQSLSAFLESGNRITQKQLVDWALVLAGALRTMHESNPPLLHCDIKPDNILIQKGTGKPFLIDFNVSVFLGKQTLSGFTPGFVPPAWQTNPNLMPAVAIDIYGLGATLYWFITRNCFDPANPDWQSLYAHASPVFSSIVKNLLTDNGYTSMAQVQQALQSMQEIDTRMQAHHKKWQTKRLSAFACLGLSLCLLASSFLVYRNDRQAAYGKIVETQQALVESGDYTTAISLYDEAVKLDGKDLQTWFQKALALYKSRQFEETVRFLKPVHGNRTFKDQDNLENVTWILADSLFQQKKYGKALEIYEDLVSMDDVEPAMYRDYAICAAYAGRLDQAKSILDDAALRGLEEDGLLYASGELDHAAGDSISAITKLTNVVQTTQDESLLANGYRQLCLWHRELGDLENARATLQEGMARLPQPVRKTMLMLLANVQNELALRTGKDSDIRQALATMEEMDRNGLADKDIYANQAVLAQMAGDYEKASLALDKRESAGGNDYIQYKRRAMLEAAIQNAAPESRRNYSRFETLYLQAFQLYDANTNDREMMDLEVMRNDIRQGGWL